MMYLAHSCTEPTILILARSWRLRVLAFRSLIEEVQEDGWEVAGEVGVGEDSGGAGGSGFAAGFSVHVGAKGDCGDVAAGGFPDDGFPFAPGTEVHYQDRGIR